MIFRKHEILPVYAAGSDFNVLESGKITRRKPKKEDIEYYEVTQKWDGWEIGRTFTIPEAKDLVRKFEKLAEVYRD